jgi:hypothetical protein
MVSVAVAIALAAGCSSAGRSTADRSFAEQFCGDVRVWGDHVSGLATTTESTLAHTPIPTDRRRIQAGLLGQAAAATTQLAQELSALAETEAAGTAARILGVSVSQEMSGAAAHIGSIQQRWLLLPVASAARYDAAKTPLRQEFSSVTKISIDPSSLLPASAPSTASLMAALQGTRSCKGITN